MIKTKLIRAGIFLAGFGFVAGATLFAIAWFTVSIPDPNAYVNSQSTIIQYSNGAEIGRLGAQNRTVVPLAKIPLNVRHAVLAAEDRSFYTNRAFSITGILRAVVNNLRGGALQGGSTITQQYAKTAFLTPERSIQRKIKELVIAIKLENQMSKDQILENYLNTIYFGRGSYGVETAAQQYFSRDVNKLTLGQAAVLASILRSPGYYDPQYSKENAARLKAFDGWIVDSAKMQRANPDALFMHCLPAHRGEEVSAEVIDGPQSVVWDEAENRLHVQKALLEYLVLGKV
jgi:membrane peptidoglycan carboxypeptidase